MASSSDEEDVVPLRRSAGKKIFDSDVEESSHEDNNALSSSSEAEAAPPTNVASGRSKKRVVRTAVESDSDDDSSSKSSKDDEKPRDNSDENHDGTDDVALHGQLSLSGDSTADGVSEETQRQNVPSPDKVSTSNIMAKLTALAGSDSESDVDGDLDHLSDLESSPNSHHPRGKNGIVKSFSSKRKEQREFDSGGSSEREGKKSKGSTKSKPRSERKSKTVAKSAMLEIKAESQRRLRESRLSLPYHVPKQRTLSEFLSRRRTSVPVKGPADTLISVWKEIEEREKEAEDFYKPESESNSDDESNNEAKGDINNMLPSDQTEEAAERTAAEPSEVGKENSALNDNANNSDEVMSVDAVPECEKLSICQSDDTVSKPNVAALVSQDIHLHLSETQLFDSCSANKSQFITKVGGEMSDSKEEEGTESLGEVSERKDEKCGKSDCSSDVVLFLPNTKAADVLHSEDFVLAVEDTESWGKDDSIPVSENNQAKSTAEHDKINDILLERGFEMTDSEDDTEDDFVKVPVAEQVGRILNKSEPSFIPKLSLKGTPNGIIDLDDIGPTEPHLSGVHNLMERFIKHSTTKPTKSSPQTFELSVISSEKDKSGDIVEVSHESFKVSLSAGEEISCTDQKPGAKLKLLKDGLSLQMKKLKEEEWQRKQAELKKSCENDEKEECNGLDLEEDEEEEDMTENETESEPEINDVREPKKRKRKKIEFLDEEAEVEDDNECSNHASEASVDDEDDDQSEEEEGIEESDSNVEGKCQNEEESCSVHDALGDKNELKDRFQRTNTGADIFASQSSLVNGGCNDTDDDDLIPAAQPNRDHYPKSSIIKRDEVKDSTCNLAPVNFSFSDKNIDSSFQDIDSQARKDMWSQDSVSSNEMNNLFTESDVLSTQDKMNELLGLCSGKFCDSASQMPETFTQSESAFSLTTQNEDTKGIERSFTSTNIQVSSVPSQSNTAHVEESQDFTLSFNCDDFDQDSGHAGSRVPARTVELELMSSDEEDAVPRKEIKKQIRKLEFSDDEDSGSENGSNHSMDDVDDDDENDEVEGKEEAVALPSREIMYDSDENEIEPAQFFENEAELSEEEWEGSEDEDEAGLDQLEMNEADKEDIDQDKVREDIVKSHMQKMLDEDRRDVRILQEMLLEDGELHSEGGGRERQFRWRNVDSTGMTNDVKNSDDEGGDEDVDEDDAEWRKKRYEREMFLKQLQEKSGKDSTEQTGEDEILEDSEFLQLGKAFLLKRRSNSLDVTVGKEPPVPKIPALNVASSPDGKRPFQLFAKRGSFLSRNDGVLAKLAKSVGAAKENVSSRAKTGGNFVFAAISPTKTDEVLKNSEDPNSKPVKRKGSASFEAPSDKKLCHLAPIKKGGNLFDHL